jgi:hypothetical protein
MSSELCRWLHEKLESLYFLKFPFDLTKLPDNGIYFFYEEGENSTHFNYNYDDSMHADNNTSSISTNAKARIVRIGMHMEGNFSSRISEHFLLNDAAKTMNFTISNPKPSDRSIFRKNIGRALLNKENDYYQKMWDIDFMTRENCNNYGIMRNIQKEKDIESAITRILREKFSFRFIPLEGQVKRIGRLAIESKLIGTIASCNLCKASDNWLGKYSPIPQIRNGKLWLSQHLDSPGLSKQEKDDLENAIINIK